AVGGCVTHRVRGWGEGNMSYLCAGELGSVRTQALPLRLGSQRILALREYRAQWEGSECASEGTLNFVVQRVAAQCIAHVIVKSTAGLTINACAEGSTTRGIHVAADAEIRGRNAREELSENIDFADGRAAHQGEHAAKEC